MCCDWEATRDYMMNLPVKDKKLFVYKGFYHCIHLEPREDKKKFTKDVAGWILERI